MLSSEHDTFVNLLLSIIITGSSYVCSFLSDSKSLKNLKEVPLSKIIEDSISEQKLHWCDISFIQHFMYNVYEWSIHTKKSYGPILRHLLITIQDYEPACSESEDLPLLNLTCSYNCIVITTVFLGINSVSFEVIVTLKYALSRLWCLSIIKFQCIKWEITQSGLNVDWQVPSKLLSHIEDIVHNCEPCGGLEIQEICSTTDMTSIIITCCIQDSQLLLDGTPLLITDMKGDVTIAIV